MTESIAELAHHPHARAVLEGALASGGASHAYLLHGPPGTGKRAAAREFAARLLCAEGDDPAAEDRARRGTHPDLTWVTPSGAAALVVGDIDEPVVAAATRTPFEATRRVFVIEGADLMNDEAANRLLKTLEEPAPFVHIVLVADRPDDLPATIRSRCQAVRFDPLPAEALAETLQTQGEPAVSAARLALGDGELARLLTSPRGERLRAAADTIVAASFESTPALRPAQDLLAIAAAAGEEQAASVGALLEERLPLVPRKEQGKLKRELEESAKRGQRRERTAVLQVGLRLVELAYRDMLCIREGAADLVYAVDDAPRLTERAQRLEADALARAIELVGETRASLRVNVSEELALEALVVRLRELLA